MVSPGVVAMGIELMKGRIQEATPSRLAAFLHTLELTGVSLCQILRLAEGEGMAPWELVHWTDGFLNRNAFLDSSTEAEVLVFGAIRGWKALLPSVLNQGTPLLKGLLLDEPGQFESLSSLPPHHFGPNLKERILRRMGYPRCLTGSPLVTVTASKHLREVMAWLGAGRPVIGYELEFQGFQATSETWGVLSSPYVVLKDGESPACLQWRSDQTHPSNWHLPSSLRIEHVRGCRQLVGYWHGQVVLKDCPDLESVDGPCQELEVEDCPKFATAVVGDRTKRLSLKGCAGLRSIESQAEDHTPTAPFGQVWSSPLEVVEIQDCAHLRILPPRLNIRGRLHLQGVGPIEAWPWDLQVGETFLITDCPDLESLPPVAVQGSLVVTGTSGLRRLSPGTVVGKHLDLRACTQLEDIPRGVKVGGAMFLPEHLNQRRQAYIGIAAEGPVLMETPQPDLYEDLRSLLKALRFPDLIPTRERLGAVELADEILLALQARLAVEPRLESLLLWTASEVWRDLAEEDWAARSPWSSDRNESDEDLPMAWFLGLVRD